MDISTLRILEESSLPDGYADTSLRSIPIMSICDTELAFISHVSDDEDNRFQMPVAIAGLMMREHRGIDRFKAEEKDFSYRHGQRVRLINIGPATRWTEGKSDSQSVLCAAPLVLHIRRRALECEMMEGISMQPTYYEGARILSAR